MVADGPANAEFGTQFVASHSRQPDGWAWLAQDPAQLRAIGQRILAEANDLKRTPDALAEELGLGCELVRAVIGGLAPPEAAWLVLRTMVLKYPVTLADLLVPRDDTVDGVRVMSAAASATSARVILRTDGAGNSHAYYEYRDTAMSSTAALRPEWIRQLRSVSGCDPWDPTLAFNRGHVLHQFTFFLGPVNFYWEIGDRRHGQMLDSGDSCYISPFVPHTFAARAGSREPAIVAVGYSGPLRAARTELLHAPWAALGEFVRGGAGADEAFRLRLARHLAGESLTEQEFRRRLVCAGLDAGEAARLVSRGPRSLDEVHVAAAVLGVRPADLLAEGCPSEELVVLQFRSEGPAHFFPEEGRPAYRMTRLAGSRHQPYLKAFDAEVLGGDNGAMCHGLHEYVYNHGGVPVQLRWGTGRHAVLEPGASAYVRPFVPHRFATEGSREVGRLLLVRVAGLLTDEATAELVRIPRAAAERCVRESEVWF